MLCELIFLQSELEPNTICHKHVPGHYDIKELEFLAVKTMQDFKGSRSEAPVIPNLGTN
jgi:hypothetical protein